MTEGDYIIDASSNTYRLAMDAEEEGEHVKAYKLFGALWKSPFWSDDRDVQLHYANACEMVGDHETALKVFTKLMKTMKKHPVAPTNIQANMSTLKELVEDVSLREKVAGDNLDFDSDDARLVNELFKYGTETILPANKNICEMGDIATHMWLLLSGEVDVLISNISVATLIGSVRSPCLMGELAYFTGMRRTASLRSTTEVRLLELPFTRIIDAQSKDKSIQPLMDHLFRSRLGFHLLGKHEIFKKLDDDDRKEVAESFQHADFLPGKILVEQGKPCDNAFMVQSGTLLMLKKSKHGNYELISSMHPGDMFHLGGLLQGFNAPYRVVTGTPCRVLRLKTETFAPMMQKNHWLIKDILAHSREEAERQILHPEKDNLWAANRYIKMRWK